MVDEERDPSAKDQPQADDPQDEEIVEPQSKYELIMMAAAEAARLNDEIRSRSEDEMRRKGINVEGKIALEALRRVREGKVKAVMRKSILHPIAPPAPAPSSPKPKGLFFSPPKPEQEDEAATPDSDAGDTTPKSEE